MRLTPLSRRDVPSLRLARRAVRTALAHTRRARIEFAREGVAGDVERLHSTLLREDRRLTALIHKARRTLTERKRSESRNSRPVA